MILRRSTILFYYWNLELGRSFGLLTTTATTHQLAYAAYAGVNSGVLVQRASQALNCRKLQVVVE